MQKIDENMENSSKEFESINKQNPMEILELKSSVPEIKKQQQHYN